MMQCIQCSCKIEENGQFYIAGDMGQDIIALLTQSLGPLFDKDGRFCSQCFASIIKLLPKESMESDNDTLSVASSVSIKSGMDSDVTEDAYDEPVAVSTVPVAVSTVPVAVSYASGHGVKVISLTNTKQCYRRSTEAEKHHTKIITPRQKETDGPKPGSSDTQKSPKRKTKETDEPKPGSSDTQKSPKRKTVSKPYPPNFLSSPMRKRPKNHGLTSNEKTIALNIYKYINKTTTTYPYKTDINAQVAEIMGTSLSTIKRVLQEYNTTGRVSSPPPPRLRASLLQKLDASVLAKIKRIVQQLEATNEVSVDNVLTAISEEEGVPKFPRSTFYSLLKKLNVKFSKNNRNSKVIK